MTAESWQRLDRIFGAALELAPDARLSFVLDETRDDDELRAEVMSLLSAETASGGFMAASAFERLAQLVGKEGWTLVPGERIGAYTVLGLVGRGGSGEVWRARDDRLGREVAIKVLLPHLSEDPGRLRRFAEEAQTAGSLNHPNIVAVYDIGERGGTPFFVSELLEGQSLRTRLESAGMRVADVITIATAITRGLAAAHARGIVHRDLKPENVFLGRNGVVKILDFGVAKLQRSIDSETVTAHTMAGMIVGTAGYMAPEQVRGEDTDARADLFAVGVMLYEMLAGAAPFARTNGIESLHAILTVEPAGLSSRNHAVPAGLARIVMRLLDKDREQRFQSASDLVWALEQADRHDVAGGAPAATRKESFRPGRKSWFALAAAVLLASALGGLFVRRSQAVGDAEITRFSWALPDGVSLASAPAVSPDGRRVAFVGADATDSRLFIRALSDVEARSIEGSDGARQPFWSADSRWVGFFANGRLMKVSVEGGYPVVVTDDTRARAGARRFEHGGAWNRDGRIVYGPNFNPPSLFAVEAAGGAPEPTTNLLDDGAEQLHRFPTFLPDGRHFVYQIRARRPEGRGVFVGALGARDAERVRLLGIDSNAIYAPAVNQALGVLLYVANGQIEAQRFDPARLSIVGPAQPLAIDAGGETLFHPAAIGASSRVLAYASQLPAGYQIKAIGADGDAPSVISDRQEQQWPRISSDGTRMAWLLIDRHQGADIWVDDLARRTRTRVTTTPGRDMGHVWSPDGRRLAYLYDLDQPGHLRIVDADGSGTSQDVQCPRAYCEPTDWSSDGRELVVNSYEMGSTDVWAIAVKGGGTSRPLLETRFNERDARLSPDRRWIAYVSDEAGRPEVSVRRLDGSVRRYTVSSGGGDQVVWQRDGRALYYVDPAGRLRKVPVQEIADGLRFGTPAELPVVIGSGHSNTQYDVAPDGRIYYLDPALPAPPTEIRLVLGWQALLK